MRKNKKRKEDFVYNAERKQMYIDDKMAETIVSPYFLKNSFLKTESFETELNKDLCDFNAEEIINCLKAVSFASLDSVIVFKSTLSLYTDWCMQKHMIKDNQNHFIELTRQNLQDCVNVLVVNKQYIPREMVLEWGSKLPNVTDLFILLCLYEGIRGKGFEEILMAKISDFDEAKNIYHAPTRDIKVTPYLIRIAKEANKEKEYTSISSERIRNYILRSEDLIVKSLANQAEYDDPIHKRVRMTMRLARIFDYLGVLQWMNANALVMSGVISMIKTRSKQLGITPREYICNRDLIAEVEQQYNKSIYRIKVNFLQKYQSVLA